MGPTKEMALLAASERMREYERRAKALNSKEETLAQVRSDWLTKTTAKQEGLTVKQRYEQLKAKRNHELDERRAKLANKLLEEDFQYKQELLSQKETPEQRRERMTQRARELGARREEERQQLAQTLYNRAFMENCDVLRETNAKRVLYRTLDERNAQIEEKTAARIAEAEENRYFQEEPFFSEQRFLDDKAKVQERRDATIRALEEQVNLINLKRADEASAKKQEVQELRELWDQMARDQEEEEIREREHMKKLSSELQQYNILRQTYMSDNDRKEKELDLKILQQALTKEAREEAEEAAAKLARIADIRRYREKLALLMGKEAEDEAERNAWINSVAEAQQAKRDAELQARDDARRKLMAEVQAIRDQQVYYKQQQRQMLNAEKDVQRKLNEEALAAQAADEARARTELKKKQLLSRLETQTQIVAKAHIAAVESDEKLRAMEIAQQQETAYLGQVTATLKNSDPPVWYGKKKFQW